MAVWALEECGLRCIIAESYGDIFFNNCFQNGILPIALPAPQVAALSGIASAGGILNVSLPECTVWADGIEPMAFQIPLAKREALLSGLDEIGQTLKLRSEIEEFQARDKVSRPWVYVKPLHSSNQC